MVEIVERILAALIIMALLTLLLFLAFPNPPKPNGLPPDTIPWIFTWPWEWDFNIDRHLSYIIYSWGGFLLLNLAVSSFGGTFRISVPGWQALKALSEDPAFKLSYVALVLIPFAIFLLKVNYVPIRMEVPLNAKLSYFSAVAFALSTILHAIASPKGHKPAEADHPPQKQDGNLFMRWLCYTAFMYGVLFALLVLYRTSLYVFRA
jgi:hypothetical protein